MVWHKLPSTDGSLTVKPVVDAVAVYDWQQHTIYHFLGASDLFNNNDRMVRRTKQPDGSWSTHIDSQWMGDAPKDMISVQAVYVPPSTGLVTNWTSDMRPAGRSGYILVSGGIVIDNFASFALQNKADPNYNLYLYDIHSQWWHRMPIPSNSSILAGIAAYDPVTTSLYVLGGTNPASMIRRQLYKLDLSQHRRDSGVPLTWELQVTAADMRYQGMMQARAAMPPTAYAASSLDWRRGQLMVWGGYDIEISEYVFHSSLVRLNITGIDTQQREAEVAAAVDNFVKPSPLPSASPSMSPSPSPSASAYPSALASGASMSPSPSSAMPSPAPSPVQDAVMRRLTPSSEDCGGVTDEFTCPQGMPSGRQAAVMHASVPGEGKLMMWVAGGTTDTPSAMVTGQGWIVDQVVYSGSIGTCS